MNLLQLLFNSSLQVHHRPAIFDTTWGKPRCHTFGELSQAILQAAAWLAEHGLQSGSRVLVFCPMSAELYVMLGALWHLGAIALFLDPGMGWHHLADSCRLARPDAMIAPPLVHALRLGLRPMRQIPLQFSLGWPLPSTFLWQPMSHAELSPSTMLASPQAPALLTFTSGSTGLPKPVYRSHHLLWQQYLALQEPLRLWANLPPQVDLTSLPIFALANLATGITTLIPRGNLRRLGTIAIPPILNQIRCHRPDRLTTSPGFLANLIQYCLRRNLTLDCLKFLFVGGAPLFPHLFRQCRQVFPQAEITIIYGASEVEPIAWIRHPDFQTRDLADMEAGKGLLVGKPVSSLQLRIRPYTHQPNSATNVGEIEVAGSHVLRPPEAPDPWHATGDAGYQDAQGRLWLLGRGQARVMDDRGTLYPFAVETFAAGHPGVRRSALIGWQGKRLLLVEADRPLDTQSLAAKLAWAKLDKIHQVKHLPVDRRHHAKIAYQKLSPQDYL